MQFVKALLKLIIKAPTLVYKNGHAYSAFNQLQYLAHPDVCLANFNKSIRTCPPSSQERQRRMMGAYFGPEFLAPGNLGPSA